MRGTCTHWHGGGPANLGGSQKLALRASSVISAPCRRPFTNAWMRLAASAADACAILPARHRLWAHPTKPLAIHSLPSAHVSAPQQATDCRFTGAARRVRAKAAHPLKCKHTSINCV